MDLMVIQKAKAKVVSVSDLVDDLEEVATADDKTETVKNLLASEFDKILEYPTLL